MSQKQVRQQNDVFARRYDYGDEEVFVADLGTTGESAVDVLDDEAIVVFEDDGDTRQMELELPNGEAKAFITNGVLTIEVGQ